MSSLFNQTSSTNSSQNTAASGASSGSTSASSTPTFSPQLQQMMDQLLSFSGTSMSNPMQQLQPIENAGLQAINQTYANAPNQVAKQMASRGYGSSGTMGDAMYNTNLARAGAVSSFQGGLAQDAINQQNFGASLGEQLLNTGKGVSSTGTTSGTTNSDSSSSGTSTTTQSGLGEILQSLSSLLMLGTGLGGASSGGGSSGGVTPTLANWGGGGYSPGDYGEGFDSGGNDYSSLQGQY